MGQLKQSSTAGGGLVWTQTNLPLAPQETTLLYKGMEVVDNTNNQTVGGNKTFTGTVKINNAPVASTDGVNKSYADSLSAQAVKSVTGTDPIVATAGKTPVISIKDATPTQKGSMSAADKAKLGGHPTLVVNKAGDTMTGNLTTTAGLYADGEIRSKNGLISTDSSNTYTTRIAVVGSIGYFQSGATNRDITDQKMILTGWLGTPLTMSKFTMANGVNPQVQWGSTNYDILHRGNMPTVTDLNAVSKSGDTIAHLTINPYGYFKQNYGLESGYKISKALSSITDTKAGLIVLGEIKTTNQNPEGFAGTISIQRGSSSTNIITNVINLVVKKAYNMMDVRIISTTPPRAGGRLCKITHEDKDYIAYYSPSASARSVVVDGISWGIEPFVIIDATGYVLSDLTSSTDTIRTDTNDYMLNNKNNERVPSWGVSEGQGFVMHGKTAIGGANDGWLRLNPFDAFTTGIYTGNGIIRHGGTSIQLGSLGDVQATTLYRPNDAAWSLTTGGYAAVSVKQQTSSSAHWLLGSYKSSAEGDMRAGIQVLSNDTGTMRIYTNMRTHYAEISNGNILVSGAQSSSGSSLTKKDYVDSQDALKLNKAGDTMTGNLTVNANINASNIFSTGSITANTTSTYSGLRLSSNASGYSEIVPRRANEADYLWSNGIRYYDSNNYWAIGSNRILHDAYSPRLTSIASPSDLNTISVPVKTMSLAHFWSSATNKPNTSDSANSVVHISTYETGTYAHQLAFSSDGKIYNRYNNNVSWSDWGQVYTSIYKPTPADVGAVNKTGDTMTGNLSTPKVLLTAAQGAEANSVTRRDFVEATVTAAGSGKKDLTIALPSGAPATGYIPVSFHLFSQNSAVYSEVYISTKSGGGSLPMNNCSFDGIVRSSGWSDGTTYSSGYFTIHDSLERSLHSFHGGAESASFFVAYVETRAFPINVRVDVGVTVTASATDVTFGTSVFKVNGQDGGNTKTAVIANFSGGSGYYNRSNRVYDTGYNPTPDDVGAVDKAGDSMSGQLTLTPGFVDTSVNAQLAHIGKDATKALYIRNMREHNSSAWVWEKLYNGSLYYSSGTNGYGTNKIRLLVSGTGSGEIYLGANADKRVYHEGFKPTAGDVGAAPSGYGLGVNAPLIHDRSGFFANASSGVAGYPGNAAGFRSTYSSNRRAQIYMNSSGAVYSRFSLGSNVIDTSTPWAIHYTTLNKPTPADLGAVNKAGDTMTGRLLIEGRNSAGSFGVKRLNSTQFANYGQSGDNGGEVIIGVGPTAEDFVAYLKVGLDKLTFQNGLSVERKIYHEGFKPNPADVGAVNKAGDTMTGDLTAPAVLVSSAQNTSVNALTRKDYVDAAIDTKASNRVNFATGLGIARAITGATLPTHAGL